MPEKLIVWGAGGQGRVVSNIARLLGTFEIVGFLDDVNPGRRGEHFCGATILGGAERLDELAAHGVRSCVLAFGNSTARLRWADAIQAKGLRLATLIHPTAVIAPDVSVGAGTTVNAGAIVDPGVTIGKCVIVGAGVTVGHDSTLADGVRVSGGTNLGGAVTVERGAMLGTGTSIKNGIRIGAGSLVGIGAVVVEDLPEGVVAFGVPARVVRRVRADDI